MNISLSDVSTGVKFVGEPFATGPTLAWCFTFPILDSMSDLKKKPSLKDQNIHVFYRLIKDNRGVVTSCELYRARDIVVLDADAYIVGGGFSLAHEVHLKALEAEVELTAEEVYAITDKLSEYYDLADQMDATIVGEIDRMIEGRETSEE